MFDPNQGYQVLVCLYLNGPPDDYLQLFDFLRGKGGEMLIPGSWFLRFKKAPHPGVFGHLHNLEVRILEMLEDAPTNCETFRDQCFLMDSLGNYSNITPP